MTAGRQSLSMAEWRFRVQARAAFHFALRRGHVRCQPKNCEHCGVERTGKGRMLGLAAHHKDYSKPLDVVWLCHSCHLSADVARRRAEKLLAKERAS